MSALTISFLVHVLPLLNIGNGIDRVKELANIIPLTEESSLMKNKRRWSTPQKHAKNKQRGLRGDRGVGKEASRSWVFLVPYKTTYNNTDGDALPW